MREGVGEIVETQDGAGLRARAGVGKIVETQDGSGLRASVKAEMY